MFIKYNISLSLVLEIYNNYESTAEKFRKNLNFISMFKFLFKQSRNKFFCETFNLKRIIDLILLESYYEIHYFRLKNIRQSSKVDSIRCCNENG